MTTKKQEKNGQFMTPPYIVNAILSFIHPTINNKIMEPSFGTGNFLVPILDILIHQTQDMSRQDAAQAIKNTLYGIEKNNALYQTAINRLSSQLSSANIPVEALDNLVCGDTLQLWTQYKHQMDVIVGNPPFIRIHDLSEIEKAVAEQLKFTSGITDSYIIFTELAMNMLAPTGKLLFIVPTTILTNYSVQPLLQACKPNINTIIFLPQDTFQANVRTCCLYITKNQMQITQQCTISPNGDINPTHPYIYSNLSRQISGPWHNGIATNADKIFIGTIVTNDNNGNVYFLPKIQDSPVLIEKSALKKAIKGSKGRWVNEWIIYLYDKTPADCPLAFKYLEKYKQQLEVRDTNQKYWQYGRTQGLQQVGYTKWIINPYIAPSDKVPTIFEADEASLTYAGLYALKKDFPNLHILLTDEFLDYAKANGRKISGEYIVISSRIINSFLKESENGK